ncbi:MAG: adenylyl-sulfate kinase [Nitrospiraceae bacterium]|nr:MAG: adenylyl-sulfate kinase [Nitrospiraceae bacterium]
MTKSISNKKNTKSNNVIWHRTLVDRTDRNQLNKHKSGILWFTGLSASGKSTIAHHLEKELYDRSIRTYVLDGDNVRHGINSNLGFSREDRRENLRRIAEFSKLFVDAGLIVLAAFISPYEKDREYIRGRFEEGDYFEIYVKCSLNKCEQRDPKGLYKKARAGIIKNYTGVSTPYEEPLSPDLVIDTEIFDLKKSVQEVLEFLNKKKFISI